ncbi:MAG TPA: BrnT family toxin [Chloroflexota bacterium]|nr:BrnT family toxin [Chloroflexota bacterium]
MYEWDEEKSQRNLEERGFDFAYAARIFESDTLEWEDTRRDYGERRIVAIGCVQALTLTVVYTPRGDAVRIISARRANRRERRAYDQAIGR